RSPAHRDLHSFPTRRSSDLMRHELQPPQGWLRCRPPVAGLAEAGDGAVVDHLASVVAPDRVEHLVHLLLGRVPGDDPVDQAGGVDRKSTRLNSSHLVISYAV